MPKTLLILILAFFCSCVTDSTIKPNSINESNVLESQHKEREELQVIIDKMVEYGTYTGSAVGISGNTPKQWDNFSALLNEASIEELKALTNHESPVIRMYAFKATCFKCDYSTVFDILRDHLNDNVYLNTHFGCMGGRKLVSDLYVEEYEAMISNNEVSYQSNKLQLDSLLLFTTGLKLNSRITTFDALELKNSNYVRLKEILTIEKELEAIVPIAKYKKLEDKTLIMRFLNQSDKDAIELGLRAVVHFPDPQFYPSLKNIQINSIEKDNHTGHHFLRNMYQALVQYKTEDCKNLLLNALNEKDDYKRKNHNEFIWLALQRFPDPTFESIEKQLEVSDYDKKQLSHWLRWQ